MLSLRCLVQSANSTAECCSPALMLVCLVQNCCLGYWERKKKTPNEPILTGRGRIKRQDHPCTGLRRLRGSLTVVRSCVRLNPVPVEFPRGVSRALSPLAAGDPRCCSGASAYTWFQLSARTASLYEYVLGNNVPIGSGDINNVCGEAHKCKLEFSSVVFVLNHLDETILKALSFPWHLE